MLSLLPALLVNLGGNINSERDSVSLVGGSTPEARPCHSGTLEPSNLLLFHSKGKAVMVVIPDVLIRGH